MHFFTSERVNNSSPVRYTISLISTQEIRNNDKIVLGIEEALEGVKGDTRLAFLSIRSTESDILFGAMGDADCEDSRTGILLPVPAMGWMVSILKQIGNLRGSALQKKISLIKAPVSQVRIHIFEDVPLYTPFIDTFGYEGLRDLLSLASSEKTILFCSEYPSRASICCFALRACLQPLPWPHLFKPIMTYSALIQYTRKSKEPLIAGINKSIVALLLITSQLYKNVWIASCDNGYIGPVSGSVKLCSFPKSESLRKGLKSSDAIVTIYKYWIQHCIGQYRRGFNQDPSDPLGYLFPSLFGAEKEHLSQAVNSTSCFKMFLKSAKTATQSSFLVREAAKSYPNLYPEISDVSTSDKFLGMMKKAKNAIKTLTSSVMRITPQYCSNTLDIFGSGDLPDIRYNSDYRLPFDVLFSFEPYHSALQPSIICRSAVDMYEKPTNTISRVPEIKGEMGTCVAAPAKVPDAVCTPESHASVLDISNLFASNLSVPQQSSLKREPSWTMDDFFK
eukprot:Tbor_TRINITY_DN5255_c6_g3::TRINITY_DN5255_c6_g3_i1::g.16622::m.16622